MKQVIYCDFATTRLILAFIFLSCVASSALAGPSITNLSPAAGAGGFGDHPWFRLWLFSRQQYRNVQRSDCNRDKLEGDQHRRHGAFRRDDWQRDCYGKRSFQRSYELHCGYRQCQSIGTLSSESDTLESIACWQHCDDVAGGSEIPILLPNGSYLKVTVSRKLESRRTRKFINSQGHRK